MLRAVREGLLSRSNIRVVTSRKMREAGHVARMGKTKNGVCRLEFVKMKVTDQ